MFCNNYDSEVLIIFQELQRIAVKDRFFLFLELCCIHKCYRFVLFFLASIAVLIMREVS